MKAESLISDKVICNGIVNPEAAASGCGDVNDGFENRYVFNGLACFVYVSFAITIQTNKSRCYQ